MAKNDLPEEEGKTQKPIKPGTPEMEYFLQVGYPGMTVARANQIIEERKKDPHLWPLERVDQAEAFLAAYHGKSRPISTDPGWKRTEQ
jgi:hypothetical protein